MWKREGEQEREREREGDVRKSELRESFVLIKYVEALIAGWV